MRYDKSEIHRGMRMTLDASGVGPIYLKRSTPRAPRYGDPPDCSEISDHLDQIRTRLEKLRADLRAARVRR